MKMDVLHCKTVLGVLKELVVFTLLYNLVRLVILQSAHHQQVDIERISFIDALRWFCAPDSGVPWEELFVNPSRPNRVEPRVQKRRPKSLFEKYQAASRLSIKRVIATYTNVSLVVGNSS
jgi:hypothetical protein